MTHVMMDVREVARQAVSRHNLLLLQALLDAGHSVTALCDPHASLPAGVRALPVTSGVEAWGKADAFALLGWPRLVEAHRPDVVLGTTGTLPLGRCAARRVLVVHDVGLDGLGPVERTTRRVRLASGVAAADVVVVGSRWLADEVVLRHPHARVSVVPPLVARAPRKDAGARVRLNGLGLLPGQCFCVPFTEQARQALPTLMEAFAGVPMELDPQLVLMASESDWSAGAHVDFLDEEHRDAVVLTDEMDPLTRQDVIRHAAALLHPCVSDGVMLEALEGQALGAAIITSQVPAAAEVLGRGITQVAHGDVDGWHDAMVQALEGTLPAPSPRRKDATAAWLAMLQQVMA